MYDLVRSHGLTWSYDWTLASLTSLIFLCRSRFTCLSKTNVSKIELLNISLSWIQAHTYDSEQKRLSAISQLTSLYIIDRAVHNLTLHRKSRTFICISPDISRKKDTISFLDIH